MKNLLTLITLAIIVFTGVNDNNSILLTDLTDKSNQSFIINQYADDHLLKNSVNFSGQNAVGHTNNNMLSQYSEDSYYKNYCFSDLSKIYNLENVAKELDVSVFRQFSINNFVN